MKKLIEINGLEKVAEAAQEFLDILNDSNEKKIAFSGKMGVGKTTFISELMRQMGINSEGSSPTFSIVDEHHSEKYGKVNHFDFYRLENEEEAYDIGIEEYLSDDSYCFMEWPEKVENVLSNQCIWVNLCESDGIRTLEFDL